MAGDPPARLAPATSDDPPAKFARAAADLLNGALLVCEECFSPQGTGSIVLAVGESDAENCHERLRPLAADTLAAVSIPLEVMDRPTADMLRRLAENGLVVPSARAIRVLYPRTAEPTLTPGEQRRAGTARDQHARRLKMTGLLAAEEMTEEARAAAIQAIHELGKALAIEQGHPEPAAALSAARRFLQDETAPIGPLLQALGSPAEAGAERAREFFEDIKARLGATGIDAVEWRMDGARRRRYSAKPWKPSPKRLRQSSTPGSRKPRRRYGPS